MKFMWFHLMPYQELPEDFKSRHSSIWVDIDSSLFDPKKGHLLYNEYIDELKFAAECGFDAVCVNEHHSNGYGLMPSPNLIASVLARETVDTAICVMGNSLALYNPPTRVAEEMAMIDCISGGRMIAGFPVGTPMDTCFAYGQNPAKLRPRYYEAIDFIQRAWTTDDTFAFNGRFNKQRYVNIWPRPVQKPHPPVWVPGGGSVETWQMCAEKNFVYANLSYFGHLSSKASIAGFWDKMEALGKEPNPFHSGFLQTIGVAETRAEALDLYSEPANYFYNRCLHINPAFANPPGYATEATVRAKVESQVLRAAEVSRIRGRSDQADVFEKGHVIIGSPDEVADQLRDVCREMNVGHLMTLLHFGNMSKDLTRYNTDLFARNVMPQIRDLFEDQWEDHWWPQPLPDSDMADYGERSELAAE
ncbi:MAG: LLM class flavin-dependent oxidoreductase [Pseudomonadota bacterium]|nr:LLM class flavin-dependent oxidoreductase [Pseudomonadota bacterium]